jgi:hypothetical protein
MSNNASKRERIATGYSYSECSYYERIARQLGCEPRDDSPEGWRRITEAMLRLQSGTRGQLVRAYAWAIPCAEALAVIAEHAPIVEMGAGLGYWTQMLRYRGVDVVAYDKCPGHVSDWGGARPAKPWAEVLYGEPAVLRDHADRSLLLCWPPYSTSMASDCLDHWRGQTLIYIGEGQSGCTGDERFHEQLAATFEQVGKVNIPQWPGIHDDLTVWRRKGKGRRRRPGHDEHVVASAEKP